MGDRAQLEAAYEQTVLAGGVAASSRRASAIRRLASPIRDAACQKPTGRRPVSAAVSAACI
jgi:hypothetical protein